MEHTLSIVYHPDYDIRLAGIERLHPFDSCKYSRAWKILEDSWGDSVNALRLEPEGPVDQNCLLKIHSKPYLDSLSKSRTIAQALEIPMLRYVPARFLNKAILNPMRYGVAGTLLAAKRALETGIAINLSGGYHHASQSRGEGFCLYADVGIAVAECRESGLLRAGDTVLIIDLDAHQGNGNEHVFREDPNVLIFDMYNKDVYPGDHYARERIDLDVPIVSGTGDDIYLSLLEEKLPRFLVTEKKPALAFYNAGTDILEKDPLGALNVSPEGILARDRFVFNLLIDADIPFVMLPSGGYTKTSYQLIASSISYLLEQWVGLEHLH